MARSHHTHIITREYDKPWEENGRKGVSHIRVALCGDESSFLMRWDWDKRKPKNPTDVQHGPKCPDCAKLFWAEKVKDLGYTLERYLVDKSADYHEKSKFHYSRSVWKVLKDGKHYGWIWLENGFGAGWRCAGHEWERGKHPCQEGGKDSTVEDVRPGGSLRQMSVRARDEALFYLHTYLLHTSPRFNFGVRPIEEFVAVSHKARIEQAEREKARKKEQAAREKERAAEAAREIAERNEAKAQLLDLAARKDLTNYQRAGLQWALEQIWS